MKREQLFSELIRDWTKDELALLLIEKCFNTTKKRKAFESCFSKQSGGVQNCLDFLSNCEELKARCEKYDRIIDVRGKINKSKGDKKDGDK